MGGHQKRGRRLGEGSDRGLDDRFEHRPAEVKATADLCPPRAGRLRAPRLQAAVTRRPGVPRSDRSLLVLEPAQPAHHIEFARKLPPAERRPKGAPVRLEEGPREDRIADLERLARLRENGALTEAEFDEEKARLLGGRG
jgi:hypothetical protein